MVKGRYLNVDNHIVHPRQCIYGLQYESKTSIGSIVIACPKCNYAVCYITEKDRFKDDKFKEWCPLSENVMEK